MLTRRQCLTGLVATSVAAARSAKVEKVFDSPGTGPNGMQATADGLWILDQQDNRAYLVSPRDGKVLRKLDTECDRGSGLAFDGEFLWLDSTYNCRILKIDAKTGKTLGTFPCPGSGPVKWPNARAAKPEIPNPVSGLYRPTSITGGHGMEWRNGKLWVAVPPSQQLYRIDPANKFMVDFMFRTPGDRPHGLGWQGNHLWLADSNLKAFHKLDTATGKVLDTIQLEAKDPTPHGMTIWDGGMWFCDADTRAVCRISLQ
jgi:streptogramin lyase